MNITREQLLLILKNLSAVEGFLRGTNAHGVNDVLEIHVVHIVDMVIEILDKDHARNAKEIGDE